MKTMILAGGLGTRIREMTEDQPKPMVEVGGKPLIWHIMKGFRQFGHRDFVVCLGYKGDAIRKYFLNYDLMINDVKVQIGTEGGQTNLQVGKSKDDLEITLAETGLNTMTGGRIKRASAHLGDDQTFMATYGDGLSDVNIDELLAFHKSHGKLATLTAVQPESRFGILKLNGNSVEQFIEKPKLDGWINAGFFVFEREVLNYIDNDDTVLEQTPLERLANEGQLECFKHEGFFYAMDTFREYQKLNEMWAIGTAPWRTWT